MTGWRANCICVEKQATVNVEKLLMGIKNQLFVFQNKFMLYGHSIEIKLLHPIMLWSSYMIQLILMTTTEDLHYVIWVFLTNTSSNTSFQNKKK